MISIRPWFICIALAVLCCGGAPAQQSSGTSGTGTSGASSSFGSPASPALGSPPPGSVLGPATSGPAENPTGVSPGSDATGFGTGIGTGTPAASGQAAGTELPGGGSRAAESPTSFSVSTGFGRAPEIFVLGEGRLARPRFQTRLSTSIGFDDNIFQTPTDAQGTPDIVIQQQITAGTEAQVVLVPFVDRRGRQRVRQVTIPAVEPEFEEIVIPGTPKPERKGSAISRASLSFNAQTATRRSVFTFDMNVNADYYWDRPQTDKAEYNGSLAVRYLHRFTPRLQVSASLDASYLSQPDLTQINTPTTTGNGNYLVLTAKGDVSYRWTPRFSSVLSLGYNSLSFEEAARQAGDYSSFTVGAELRYLWTPKLTLAVEGRYQHIAYTNNPALDATTYFGLVGIDLSLSRRAAATIRVGASARSFDESGGESIAPYLETTLSYQLARASALSWTNRFGFEEPPDPNTEVLSFRTGLNLTHFFTPRLRGSLGVNGFYRTITNDLAQTESTETTLDTSLSLLYTLTRKWTLNLNYSYTTVFFDPVDTSNYFRNRIFAGFDYSF